MSAAVATAGWLHPGLTHMGSGSGSQALDTGVLESADATKGGSICHMVSIATDSYFLC